MAHDDNDGAWFAARGFGYGAGMPIAWQGWALLAAIGGLTLGAVAIVRPHHAGFVPLVMAATTLPFFPIARAKTRGGWRWRWRSDRE